MRIPFVAMTAVALVSASAAWAQNTTADAAPVIDVHMHAMDDAPGDIVVWSLASAEKHIGIVVPGPEGNTQQPWIVHHLDDKLRWENVLFDFRIEGHYRYHGKKAE